MCLFVLRSLLAGTLLPYIDPGWPSNGLFLFSFILAISIAPIQVHYYSEAHTRLQHGYCIGVSRRSAQATVSKGLAQGPYMAARAAVEPMTLQLRVIDSTNAPPHPSSGGKLVVSRVNTSTMQHRAFSIAAPSIRNSLPSPIRLYKRSTRLCSTSCLKLIFFSVVGLGAPLSRFLEGRYINFTK